MSITKKKLTHLIFATSILTFSLNPSSTKPIPKETDCGASVTIIGSTSATHKNYLPEVNNASAKFIAVALAKNTRAKL